LDQLEVGVQTLFNAANFRELSFHALR
jgi:hypothetical protein